MLRLSLPPLVLALWLVPATASANATFTPLGTLPGATDSTATALSDDGTTVVGETDHFSTANRAWRWTATTGMVELPRQAGHGAGVGYGALGLSNDGSYIVGFAFDPGTSFFGDGMLWSDPNLAPTSLGMGMGVDVSNDGSTVAGQWQLFDDGRAWRWTAATGMVFLTDPPGPPEGCQCPIAAAAITGDGTTIFGDWRELPVSWTSTNPGVLLDLGSHESGAVLAASGDGALPVGQLYSPPEATGWFGGVAVHLVEPNTGIIGASASAVSAAGRVIAGQGLGGVFVWDAVNGTRDLGDLANAHGAALGSFALGQVDGVSSDGLTFAGTGTASAGAPMQAWVLTLPPEAFPATPVRTLPLSAFAAFGLLLGAALFEIERRGYQRERR